MGCLRGVSQIAKITTNWGPIILPMRTLAVILSSVSLLISGCGGKSGNILALGKSIPDEFSVVSRAPLSLPPDYSLRPPSSSSARTQDTTPRKRAQKSLLGNTQAVGSKLDANVVENLSLSEISLLQQSNALAVNDDIRNLIDSESAALAREDVKFLESLIFWKSGSIPGVIIDPKLEAKRLQENSALGKSTTEGPTPTIKRKGLSIF